MEIATNDMYRAREVRVQACSSAVSLTSPSNLLVSLHLSLYGNPEAAVLTLVDVGIPLTGLDVSRVTCVISLRFNKDNSLFRHTHLRITALLLRKPG